MTLPHNIIGHATILQQLKNDIAQENVAHAYLLSGQKHLGKMTICRWFATELLSIDRENPERVRDDAEKLIHPDLVVVDDLWKDGDEHNARVSLTTNLTQEHRMKQKMKTDTMAIDEIGRAHV